MEKFEVTLNIMSIMEYPNIRRLSKYLSDLKNEKDKYLHSAHINQYAEHKQHSFKDSRFRKN